MRPRIGMLITAASRPLGAGCDVIVDAGRYAEDLGYRYGFVEEARRIRKLWREDRTSAGKGVSGAMIAALSVTGTPDQVRQGYAALFEAGVDAPSILLPPATPQDIARETAEALSPDAWDV